jgi:prepilin-type N-terminal cleavage/methylation domain-containing protein
MMLNRRIETTWKCSLRRGFSLVELLVVIGIIALLLTMLTAGIVAVKRYQARAEAALTMKEMAKSFAAMKKAYDFGLDLPVGVYVGGETTSGTTDFTDPRATFAAEGVGAGDELLLLEGAAQGSRKVTGRTGNVLHLAGAPFAKSERSLAYFIVGASGENCPRVYPAKELHPNMNAWRSSFTPHLNTRRASFFDVPARKVRDGWFRDPWGTPYAYRLVPRKDVIAELLLSAGPDRKFGTADDIEELLAEVPFTP